LKLDGPDEFPYGPLSTPIDDFFHLPETCKVKFVQTLEDLKEAEELL